MRRDQLKAAARKELALKAEKRVEQIKGVQTLYLMAKEAKVLLEEALNDELLTPEERADALNQLKLIKQDVHDLRFAAIEILVAPLNANRPKNLQLVS